MPRNDSQEARPARGTVAAPDSGPPDLCGILVHWHDEEGARRLAGAWPVEPGFELLVVDNGSRSPLDLPDGVRLFEPEMNLGFAGAVNLALDETEAKYILILNSDVQVTAESLRALLAGFAAYPDTAGLAPSLLGTDSTSQHRWQLRPIPSATSLVLQALWLATGAGPRKEPDAGATIEQPAAAALALRRDILTEIGGLDERFHPAWFEDVDLAVRLRDAGHEIRYWPTAQFVHALGGSVGTLGFGSFLRIYYANLCRYLAKHHGREWVLFVRPALFVTALARLALLPVRKPRRARNRREAARGLLQLAGWALSGRPRPVAPSI